MAWGGGGPLNFGSVYRFLSSSIATELKLDLSRVDQAISTDSGRPMDIVRALIPRLACCGRVLVTGYDDFTSTAGRLYTACHVRGALTDLWVVGAN